jgi:hypothetical protein
MNIMHHKSVCNLQKEQAQQGSETKTSKGPEKVEENGSVSDDSSAVADRQAPGEQEVTANA